MKPKLRDRWYHRGGWRKRIAKLLLVVAPLALVACQGYPTNNKPPGCGFTTPCP